MRCRRVSGFAVMNDAVSQESSQSPLPAVILRSPLSTQFVPSGLDPLSLHNFWRTVRRRWVWIIACVVTCVVLAILLAHVRKPVYASTALIELNKDSSGLDFGLGGVAQAALLEDNSGLITQLQTETSVLRSGSIALDVVQRLKLENEPPFARAARDAKELSSEKDLSLDNAPNRRSRVLHLFSQSLKVAPLRGTRILAVTFESHDPNRAAQIANAIIESYKSAYLHSHYTATAEASSWLTTQLADLKANVEDSEKKLSDFEKENSILGLDVAAPSDSKSGGTGGLHSPVIEKLNALNQELTQAEANRIEKEAIFRFANSGNAEAIAGIAQDPLAQQSHSAVLTQEAGLSNLNTLLLQIGQIRLGLVNAGTKYGENSRHLKFYQTQAQELESQLHAEVARIGKIAEADFKLARQSEADIRSQFERQQGLANQLNEKAVQFAILSQEAFSRKKLYEDLYTKLQEANVSAGIKATDITIIDPARSESQPVRPNVRSNVMVGFLVGLFLGIAGAVVWDAVDRTLITPSQVEEITGKHVIGVIPSSGSRGPIYGARLLKKQADAAVPSDAVDAMWMLSRPHSAHAEACRSLRTAILLSRPGGGPCVVLITSSIAGEGKTTVTANVGIAFAQLNKKVLIIEGDMRRPMMKHILEVPSGLGLSNVLTGSASLDDAILKDIRVSGLDVLPSGPHPPLPSEILGSPAFESLLLNLRSRYNIILIDSPPALIVTDAVIMSAQADAVIWIARAGAVVKPVLSRAAVLINRAKMPVIGFVVNGIDVHSPDYRYEYYGYESSNAYYDDK